MNAVKEKTRQPFTWTELSKKIIWPHVLAIVFYHIGFFAAVCMYAFGLIPMRIKVHTIIWMLIVSFAALVGITAGAHRLWSHRAYKANLPLRIILMIFFSTAGMHPLYYWVRDHRVHHRYVDTDADPHNSERGFLFAHLAWLLVKRHPECLQRCREVDMSDIRADKVVMFQFRHHIALRLFFCFFLPTVIPVMLWGETWLHSVLTQCFIRYVLVLNSIFCVNSIAHFWGDRPYNSSIRPTENILVSVLAAGEGSHNYHHTFPWDYKASEIPYMYFNTTTLFIDAFAKIGWAYDLRQPSKKFIDQVIFHRGHERQVGVT